MMDRALAEAFEATWPAAEYKDAGGFRVGRGLGAGGRVSSARTVGDWRPEDIDTAVEVHEGWRQRPIFRVLDGETALIAGLQERGFQRETPTAIMEVETCALTGQTLPRVTTFEVWPPLAIQRDIWTAGGIDAARQAVIDRVPQPKTAILGRIEDRAAGASLVAIHGGIAIVYGIEILADWRRKGLAGWMMRQAAFWAADRDAPRLGLAVNRANEGALALYDRMGFREVAGYAYYAKP